jgi:ectoine hydroxylase-related dioxygenase (phytanoyl-CoA dioxygenase family)
MSASCAADGALSAAQLAHFQRDGYLVLRSFFDAFAPLARAQQLVQAFQPAHHPLTRFATGDEDEGEARHVGDVSMAACGERERLMASTGLLSRLGRQGALVPRGGGRRAGAADARARAERQQGRAWCVCPSFLCLSFAHTPRQALHALDPTFHALSFSPRIAALVRSLHTHTSPRVLQSMVICKQPEIGGQVRPPHDSTFLYTDTPSALGLWFALEQCTATNGALSFIKGSHRHAPGAQLQEASRPRDDGQEQRLGRQRGVNRRFVRAQAGGTEFVQLATAEEEPWDAGKAVMEECEPGEFAPSSFFPPPLTAPLFLWRTC